MQLQYRVIQLQYYVCEQIPPLIPSHPRERIENHSKNNRQYFQVNMILIAVPSVLLIAVPSEAAVLFLPPPPLQMRASRCHWQERLTPH